MKNILSYYLALFTPKCFRTFPQKGLIISNLHKKEYRGYGIFLNDIEKAIQRAKKNGFDIDIKIIKNIKIH